MTVLDLAGTAEMLRREEGIFSALKLHEVWALVNEDSPFLYIVLFNYSVLLVEEKRYEEAAQALERSIVLNPDFMPSRINLGRIYENLGKPKRAVFLWTSTIERMAQVSGENIFHKKTIIKQLARILADTENQETVEVLLKQSLELDPTQRDVAEHYLAARQRLCKWPLLEPWPRMSKGELLKKMSPLSLAIFSDDPYLQLALNAAHNLNEIGDPSLDKRPGLSAAIEKPEGPLRIGYLSSDLRDHAIGYLMAELFELHDRSKVEIFVYYCGSVADDPMMRRIKSHVEHWTPISAMDQTEAARRIAADGIHILVDVNGYTREARTFLVAHRPAPVIVNWLGFPGSMASPYHHYIIADDWIIPKENEKYFTEKVMRLPCYQPNDRKRVVADDIPTRQDMGLPEEAMVYCCFNGPQKITRFTLDRWMTILERVPESVLWLLSGRTEAESRLRAYAESKGIAGDRLIFAPQKPNSEHLARYPLADLFLDTAPYGAHTTASDALWMGVPVLTCSGRAFASRVCGSLVRAAGLPELACASPQAYIDRAVELGNDKAALQAYREKLAASRDSCDLFHTTKLVQHLEALYEEMWKDFKSDNLPSPDLSNLDIYLEVGAEQLAPDTTEVQALEEYETLWLQSLKKRHKVRPIRTDSRLWTEENRQKP